MKVDAWSEAEVETRQRASFDDMAAQYAAHYDDRFSTEYRQRFLFSRLFAGINLSGQRVLEGMCGTGSATGYLIEQGALVSGLDISEGAIAKYRERHPKAQVLCGSMLDTGLAAASFDLVCIIGGLHHLQPHVQAGIDEVYRILKPGGYFVFFEPPAGALPDVFRKIWYRVDKYFEPNEASIDLGYLLEQNKDKFTCLSTHYGGGPAYFLVFNSMMVRMPPEAKKWIAEPLMWIEEAVEKKFPRRLASYMIVQLQKR